MAVSCIVFCLFLRISSSTKIVHYKFGLNFGQVFYDYSGSGNHGQNGHDLSSDDADTTPTDRGAYFSTSKENYIMLPPNNIKSTTISLTSSFSLAIWVKPVDDSDSDDDEFALSYRKKDDEHKFYLERVTSNSKYRVRIKNGDYDSSTKSSSDNTLKKGNDYLDIWGFVLMVNSQNIAKLYSNGILDFTITQGNNYSESGSYDHYIGHDDDSFEGFVWSFYLYTSEVFPSEFFESSYSGGNCLTSTCPSSCSPAIKENGSDYCISLSNDVYCNSCSYGCISGVCLNCNSCSSKCCIFDNNAVKCICPDQSETTTTCTCSSNKYFSDSNFQCKSCYNECSACTTKFKCSTCKDINAEIHSVIGCTCNTGFYNSTALINGGTCQTCYSDCSSCTQSLKCSSCKESHSSPHSTVGCVCNQGYYNTSSLSVDGSCLDCYSTCKTCTTNNLCTTCDDPNADPGSSFGCLCKEKYYNSTALETGGSCLACHGNCKNCTQSLKCESCLDGNSEVHSLVGCVCKKGFYNTTNLNSDGRCLLCFSECKECSSKYICTECYDSNASKISSGGCLCFAGFYNTTQIVANGICKACHADCLTCTQEFLCDNCLKSNAKPASVQGCECKEGFYNLTALNSGGTCLACHPSCKNCTQSLKCNFCIDGNSVIHDDVGCICKQGYFNKTSIDSDGICLACFAECKNCTSQYICEKCYDSNASPISSGGCLCNSRYFNTSQIISEGVCQACHSDCKTCNQSLLCLSCTDPNSEISTSKGCDCKTGFYRDTDNSCQSCFKDCSTCSDYNKCTKCIDNWALPSTIHCACQVSYFNSSLSGNLECSKCPSNCSECNSFTDCTVCKYKNMSPSNGVCECPSNSDIFEDSCIANEGYFMTYNASSGYSSEKCDPSCKTCTKSGNSCEICANNILKDDLNKCQTCEAGMFLSDYQCFSCSEDCSECLDSSFCLKCKDSTKVIENGICYQACPDFTYLYQGKCKNCPDLCRKCDPKCTECITNSSLTSSYCECIKGYKKSNNSCEAQYFTSTLTIDSMTLASVVFSESLKVNLNNSNFNFSVNGRSDFKAELIKAKSSSVYLFSLSFQDSVEKGTGIQVEIKHENLYSLFESQLENYLLTSSLPGSPSVVLNPSVQAVLNSTTAMAQTAVSSSVGAALVSNPSAAWALLNSIQILVLLPLNSNNMTKNTRTFLYGFSGYNMLPNVLNHVFNDEATSLPYLEARRYGIETSVFFLNTGKSLSIFVVTVLMYPLVLVLSKCSKGKLAAKAIKLLGNYKYGFFLRFWTQTALELLVFGLIQLRSVRFKQTVVMPVQGYFNQFFATLSVIAAVLTPPLLFVASYVSLSDINGGNEEFQQRWGSLFLEFKNDRGFWSSQFYFVYFLRRVAFALCQVYLNSFLVLQGALNIFFSVVSLGFLIVYRPFKETSILVSNMTSEISITLVMVLSYCYLWEMSSANSELIEMIIIFSVLAGMMVQFILSLFIFGQSMIIILKKIEKARSLQFVNRAEKTFPELIIK